MRSHFWILAVLSLVAHSAARAQQLDIHDKTVIVEDSDSTHVYISPSGKVFYTNNNQSKAGNEYQIGKTIRHSTGPQNSMNPGKTCHFQTRAKLLGNVLQLTLLSVSCNGRQLRVVGGDQRIEFRGDSCTYTQRGATFSCKVVAGNKLP